MSWWKPRRAHSENERCLAFNNSDHRRCRLQKMNGARVCYAHRNQYRDWFETHECFLDWFSLTKRQQAEQIFQFKNRHIHTNWIVFTKPLEDYTDLFCFLTAQGVIEPETNPTLFISAALRTQLAFAQKKDTHLFQGIQPQPFDYHEQLCRTPTACQYLIQSYLSFARHSLLRGFPTLNIGGQKEIVNLLFTKFNLRPILFSNLFAECIQLEKDILLEVITPLQKFLWYDILAPFLISSWEIYQLSEVTTLMEKTAVFKEDLIAAAWHPRRIHRWFEQGLTPDDLESM